MNTAEMFGVLINI